MSSQITRKASRVTVWWQRRYWFDGHFSVQPGKPVPGCLHSGFYWAEDHGGGGIRCSYKMCKAPVKSSPPINQHSAFYRTDALPVALQTLSKHWREKVSRSMDLFTSRSLEVSQPCLWPLKAPG